MITKHTSRVLLKVVCIALSGCASSSRTSDNQGVVPEDFQVDITILLGNELRYFLQKARGVGWPADLRPWRAIIMSDGSLRSDFGSNLGVDDRPGLTRHLYRRQIETLWKAVEQVGLSEPDATRPGNFSGNPALISAQTNEIVQIMSIQAYGQRWNVVHRFVPVITDQRSPDPTTSSSMESPKMRSIIRRVLALAWASDVPSEERFAAPERYDFGPDPWARYRTEPEAKPSAGGS